MKVAGKSLPEKERLEAAAERDFENVELYLEKKHIDSFKDTMKAVEESDVNVTSIHTPHAQLDEKDYFRKSDKLAQELDAFLVVHSQFVGLSHIEEIESRGFDSRHGYEHSLGVSKYAIENFVLEKGLELVLDTAHLYTAEENYLDKLEQLLERYHGQIGVVHLADGTRTRDGLGFGEGEMEMERVIKIIAESDFDGIVTLEVMPEEQRDALEKWREYSE